MYFLFGHIRYRVLQSDGYHPLLNFNAVVKAVVKVVAVVVVV
jgi:hypothetical protein